MFPIKVADNFRIIAHRGASGYAPENTIAAFQLAEKMGVTEVELDVQLSSDNVPVLCHDKTLERYGHGNQVVEDLTADKLLNLDMGSWFSPFFYANESMISLAQLFERYGDRFVYHVELKGEACELPMRTLAVIKEYDLMNNCIVTSFSEKRLQKAINILPNMRYAWLVRNLEQFTLALAKEMKLFQLCPKAELISPEIVKQIQQVCQCDEIRVWGMSGSPREVATLIDKVSAAGCQGMTINWPDWVSS